MYHECFGIFFYKALKCVQIWQLVQSLKELITKYTFFPSFFAFQLSNVAFQGVLFNCIQLEVETDMSVPVGTLSWPLFSCFDSSTDVSCCTHPMNAAGSPSSSCDPTPTTVSPHGHRQSSFCHFNTAYATKKKGGGRWRAERCASMLEE